MTTAEMIGIVIIALSSILGLFGAVAKPLINNTQAMTLLNASVKELSSKIDEQNKRIEAQEDALERYKDHVRESQRKQWEVLNEHDRRIEEVKHDLELCREHNGKEQKDV